MKKMSLICRINLRKGKVTTGGKDDGNSLGMKQKCLKQKVAMRKRTQVNEHGYIVGIEKSRERS